MIQSLNKYMTTLGNKLINVYTVSIIDIKISSKDKKVAFIHFDVQAELV